MADENKGETPHHAPASGHGPVMDVVPPPAPPPAEDKLHAAPPQTDQPSAQAPAKQSAKSKPVTPKAPHSGVGLAIVGTVIIVLGLATIAAYAYMQTAK